MPFGLQNVSNACLVEEQIMVEEEIDKPVLGLGFSLKIINSLFFGNTILWVNEAIEAFNHSPLLLKYVTPPLYALTLSIEVLYSLPKTDQVIKV